MTTTKEEKSPSTTDFISLGLEHFDMEDDAEEEHLGLGFFSDAESSAIKKQPIDLDKFLNDNYGGEIIQLHEGNFDDIRRPLIVSFHHYRDKCVQLKHWIDELHREALKYKGAIQFAIADAANVAILKLKWNVYHGYIYCDPRNPPDMYAIDGQNRMYACNDKSLSEFSEKLHKGELFFSETLPASNDGLVKVGVANNFDNLVNTADKDVFVNFYATWSHFSKELLSLLDELAALLKDEQVVVVKMDAEANYVPLEYCVCNYPKMFLVSSDDKSKYVEYTDGPITLEKLIKFVAANATTELKAYDREGRLKEKELIN